MAAGVHRTVVPRDGVGVKREREREERDVRPTKNQTERIPPAFRLLLLPFHLRSSDMYRSSNPANLFLPANITRSPLRASARILALTKFRQICFRHRILIRFVPPYSEPRPKFRLGEHARPSYGENHTLSGEIPINRYTTARDH